MPKSEIKKIYKNMLQNGDLLILFPNMKGNWLEDKDIFTSQYNVNERLLDDIDSDDFDDFDYFEEL